LIAGVLVFTGIVAWVADKYFFGKKEYTLENKADAGEECCGMHINCAKDTLSPVTDEVEYYEDEELDRFKGYTPAGYSNEEIEEFRNVLLTLRPEEIAGWARSIQVRGIELPAIIKEELLMIVAEQRCKNNKK